ncbi:MAG: HipA domain-containing protein [Acidimicrobiales bacterium]
MMELDIWLEDQLVARSRDRDRGRKLTIVYDESVVAAVGDEVPLLSCSLPTPGPSTPSHARSFLEGLLPEGRALETMAANMRNVRLQEGAPATPGDAASLLAQYGRECAGAVVIVPSGTDYQPRQGDYRPLDQEDLSEILRDLPEHPLGANLDRGIRMSLAGAQPKFLLARFDNKWFEPLGGAASTHILKPTTRWPYSAENEALVMHFARAAGLTASSTWVERINGTSVLAVERYDRRVEGERVVRTHQEDLCQALGIRPLNKYQIGRPSTLMARLLRRFTEAPAEAVTNLFRQVAFRALVGDEDGHGKNYSLLLNNGKIEFAPLYDSICTLVYPGLSGRMAAPIGNQSSLAKVDQTALIEEAVAMGILKSEANSILEKLAADIRASVSSLDASFCSGWPSEQVTDIITSRLDRLESGEPMDGSAVKGSPTSRPGRATDMTTQTANPEGQTTL